MSQFHFQEQFLQPFVDIFEKDPSESVHQLIVECVSLIVSTSADVLRSGWAVVYQVLIQTLSSPELVKLAFPILSTGLSKYMRPAVPSFAHVLTAVNAFVSYDRQGAMALHLLSDLTTNSAAVLAANDILNWERLFETLSHIAVNHQIFEVRCAVQESFITILADRGCMNDPFSDEIWAHVFDQQLTSLFNFSKGIELRFNGFLNELFSQLFGPFSEKFIPQAARLLNLVRHCCSLKTLRIDALICLQNFVTNCKGDFQNEATLKILLEVLRQLIPQILDINFYVEVLVSFVKLFADSRDQSSKFIEVIDALVQQANATNSEPIWCEARREYFNCITSQNREAEIVAYFGDTLALSLQKKGEVWEALVIATFQITRGMEDGLFRKVVDVARETICEFIEINSEEVRQELAKMLSRIILNKQ
jgi:hypothetical protein